AAGRARRQNRRAARLHAADAVLRLYRLVCVAGIRAAPAALTAVDWSVHACVHMSTASPPLAPAPQLREAPLWYRLARRVTEYVRLIRLDRPVRTWLLLWPELWALWIAGAGRPRPQVLLVFVLGVVVMRAAGCVINDFLDRDIDPHVQRTRDRPLAARRVSPREALVLFALLLI